MGLQDSRPLWTGAVSSVWASGGHFSPLQGGDRTGKASVFPSGFLNLASRPPQGLAVLSLLLVNSPLVFASSSLSGISMCCQPWTGSQRVR